MTANRKTEVIFALFRFKAKGSRNSPRKVMPRAISPWMKYPSVDAIGILITRTVGFEKKPIVSKARFPIRPRLSKHKDNDKSNECFLKILLLLNVRQST